MMGVTLCPAAYPANSSRAPAARCPTLGSIDAICAGVDAAWAGRVRLTFRKQRYNQTRSKASYVTWLFRYPEKFDSATLPVESEQKPCDRPRGDPAPSLHEHR
jgi:hypothetical protein